MRRKRHTPEGKPGQAPSPWRRRISYARQGRTDLDGKPFTVALVDHVELEQIIRKLRDADSQLVAGATVAEVSKKLGVSENTLHRWRGRRQETSGQDWRCSRRRRYCGREGAVASRPVAAGEAIAATMLGRERRAYRRNASLARPPRRRQPCGFIAVTRQPCPSRCSGYYQRLQPRSTS